MKKICLTCKNARCRDSFHMLCSEKYNPLITKYDFSCKDYKKLSNKGFIKRIAAFYEIENNKYNEEYDYVFTIEFDKAEGFHICTPIVIDGVREYKKGEIYYDEYDANFLANKLNNLLEDKDERNKTIGR